jgi:alpha,alpha-trehalase
MMFSLYAVKYNLPVREFEKQYLNRTLVDAELDDTLFTTEAYAKADTTNRLINTCANLNSVDLNSFLYKYEKTCLHYQGNFNNIFKWVFAVL